MPLTNIVVIVLRLFALNWLFQDIILWAEALAPWVSTQATKSPIPFIGALALLVIAVLFWVLAPRIARLVSPGADPTVDLPNLTRYDLYCFGFVFLGLYFILSSFGSVAVWVSAQASLAYHPAQSGFQTEYFYQVARPIVTIVTGLISLLGAPRWAKKLLKMEQKLES